ncbi:transposase [Candidatus Daviesbacteria bacterium]|nr:transposase [Candidatus Daviesbacteria bacterium]
MPYRQTPFINQNFYHIFNRGVEKRIIFLTQDDYDRFFQTIYYYQFSGPKPRFSTHRRFRFKDFHKNPKIVEIIVFCFMPNHFHLLIRQIRDGGIVEFMSKVLNGYTKYFNTKHRRVGALFQGQFKAVMIETDEQLLHVSRYIHLNPYVAELTKDLADFSNSSYKEYVTLGGQGICVKEHILNFFKNSMHYQKFINDYEDYALRLKRIEHLLIDIE